MPFGTVDYTKLARTKANLQDMLDRTQQSTVDMANLRAQAIARARQQQQEQGLQQLGNEFSSVVTSGISPEEVNKRLLATRVKAVTGDYGERGAILAKSVDDYLRTAAQPKQSNLSFVDREVVEGDRKKGYRDFYNPADVANPEKTNVTPIRSILTKDEPYVSGIDKSVGTDTAKDLLDTKKSVLQTGNELIRLEEVLGGKEGLKTAIDRVSQSPNLLQYLTSSDDELKQAADEGKIDKPTQTLIQNVKAYNKSLATYKASKEALQNIHHLDYINGEFVPFKKGAKPKESTAPTPQAGKPLNTRQDGKVKVKLGDGRVGFLDPKEFNPQTMQYVQ